jgi:hypothetical protein
VKVTVFKAIGTLLMLGFVSYSGATYADSPNQGRIFYSYESNGADYISSVGFGITHKYYHSNLGFQLNTSLGYAEVLAQDGFLEEYTSWEASARFGYFSNVSMFVEFGVDLAEAIFDDYRYDSDEYCYREEYCYQDDIDAFVGAGVGVKAGPFSVEAIVRAREIDSHYWEAQSEVFRGVQIAFNF